MQRTDHFNQVYKSNKGLFWLFSISFTLLSGAISAQSALTAAGGDAIGDGGSLSYSLGQVVYTTIQSDAGYVCQGVQQSYEIIPLSTSAEVKNDLFAVLYPNPSSGDVSLSWNRPLGEIFDLRVVSALGREMYQSKLSNQLSQLPLSDLASGVYFVYIYDEDELMQSFKFIKQR